MHPLNPKLAGTVFADEERVGEAVGTEVRDPQQILHGSHLREFRCVQDARTGAGNYRVEGP